MDRIQVSAQNSMAQFVNASVDTDFNFRQIPARRNGEDFYYHKQYNFI